MAPLKLDPPCAARAKKPSSIYFGGCAFGAAFYVGVVEAMADMWGKDFHKDVLFSGDSVGSIFAVGLALGKSPQYLDNLYRDVAEYSIRKGPVYHSSVSLEKKIEQMLVEEKNALRRLEGRASFGTTTFPFNHTWHVNWENEEDFMNCINGSMHIPFYTKRNDKIKGKIVIDGAYGFKGNDLFHGDDTLYVGIDPHAEVTRTFTYTEMFFPSTGAAYDDIKKSGYDAMIDWNGKMNKKCGHRVPNYSALYVLWFLSFFENLWIFLEVSVYYLLLAILYPLVILYKMTF
jgi:hypothetical protein